MTGGKLHTGRSRNDQVATDTRLWLRDECKKIISYMTELVRVCVSRIEREVESGTSCGNAKREGDYLMPGYTHLQRAQPIRWGHYLSMWAWIWKADTERLIQLYPRINQLPLGSGALAGHPFNIDRKFLAESLGFTSIIQNSLNAVSDRDFIAEFLFWSTLTMNHFSRWAEDLVIYSSAEFGYVSLSDAYRYF